MSFAYLLLLVWGTGIPTLEDSLSPVSLTTVDVVSHGWGDVSPKEVEKILLSVVSCMEKSTGVCVGENLRVEPSGGPVVLFKRDPDGSYRIRLNVSGRYWSQLIYQFSHEFGHVIARYKPDPGPQAWLEEAICEAMSFQVLKKLSVAWRNRPPFESLRNYAPHLSDYSILMSSRCVSVEPRDMAKWFSNHKTRLQVSRHDRELIRSFSRVFSKWLEEHPRLWALVPKLGRGQSTNEESICDRIDRWISPENPEEKEFADLLKNTLLGVPVQTESGSSKNQP
ncbi:hypothetical protein CBD41_05070 [bacterium TMED181]|nr:hypothetical protein [Planctomycetota bacterium]OUW44796.1 MAG: hypothetical protein CBD41_05070 [bacterium TMED181]